MHAIRWNRRELRLAAAVVLLAILCLCAHGCGPKNAKIEQHGDGKAEVKQQSGIVVLDKLLSDMDATFKAIESIKAEIRAGTQEKTDNSTVAGDQSKADAQQAGFLNLSYVNAIGTAGVGVGGSIAAWLLFAGFTRASDNKAERHESSEQTKRLKDQEEAHSRDVQAICDAFETGMEHVSNAYKSAIAARGN